MKEKLMNNFGLKLLSLLLATIVWVIVINLDDPVTARIYQNIMVEIQNEAAIASLGKVYDVVEGRTVSVTVKGKRSVVDKIKAGDLKASVDLSNISSFNKVEITASCEKYAYENLEITTKPKLMQITLEDRDEKQVNVKVVTSGVPAAGYSVGLVEAKPVMLAVSGAKSVVARIEEARVTVDINGETDTFTRRGLIPKLYDKDGEEIDASRLTFNKQEVSATVNILKNKKIPVNVTTKGTPMRGYGIYQIDYDPVEVEIAGVYEELAGISSIPIEIDVSGKRADVEQTVALTDYLPKGIRVVDNIEAVGVKVTIKKMETKEFFLTTGEVAVRNIGDGLTYKFISPETPIRISIMGMEEDLQGLTTSGLGAYIDLEGVQTGSHWAEVQLTLDEKLHLKEAAKVSVEVLSEEEEPGEPTEPGDPTEPEEPGQPNEPDTPDTPDDGDTEEGGEIAE